jgi:hypothetical protein
MPIQINTESFSGAVEEDQAPVFTDLLGLNSDYYTA